MSVNGGVCVRRKCVLATVRVCRWMLECVWVVVQMCIGGNVSVYGRCCECAWVVACVCV